MNVCTHDRDWRLRYMPPNMRKDATQCLRKEIDATRSPRWLAVDRLQVCLSVIIVSAIPAFRDLYFWFEVEQQGFWCFFLAACRPHLIYRLSGVFGSLRFITHRSGLNTDSYVRIVLPSLGRQRTAPRINMSYFERSFEYCRISENEMLGSFWETYCIFLVSLLRYVNTWAGRCSQTASNWVHKQVTQMINTRYSHSHLIEHHQKTLW
jgi:hypothetical protein